MAKRATRTKQTTITDSRPAGHTDLSGYCKDLDEWPRSWMGFEKDIPPGEEMVAHFRSFLEHLVEENLSGRTIRKHIDNLRILGGEIIRELHNTPKLRKMPVEELVFRVLQEGGPLLYHGDSEEQQRSFESTCRKFLRFLDPEQ